MSLSRATAVVIVAGVALAPVPAFAAGHAAPSKSAVVRELHSEQRQVASLGKSVTKLQAKVTGLSTKSGSDKAAAWVRKDLVKATADLAAASNSLRTDAAGLKSVEHASPAQMSKEIAKVRSSVNKATLDFTLASRLVDIVSLLG